MDQHLAEYLIEALQDQADATVWSAAYAAAYAEHADPHLAANVADVGLRAWQSRIAQKCMKRMEQRRENDRVRRENAERGL